MLRSTFFLKDCDCSSLTCNYLTIVLLWTELSRVAIPWFATSRSWTLLSAIYFSHCWGFSQPELCSHNLLFITARSFVLSVFPFPPLHQHYYAGITPSNRFYLNSGFRNHNRETFPPFPKFCSFWVYDYEIPSSKLHLRSLTV